MSSAPLCAWMKLTPPLTRSYCRRFVCVPLANAAQHDCKIFISHPRVYDHIQDTFWPNCISHPEDERERSIRVFLAEARSAPHSNPTTLSLPTIARSPQISTPSFPSFSLPGNPIPPSRPTAVPSAGPSRLPSPLKPLAPLLSSSQSHPSCFAPRSLPFRDHYVSSGHAACCKLAGGPSPPLAAAIVGGADGGRAAQQNVEEQPMVSHPHLSSCLVEWWLVLSCLVR